MNDEAVRRQVESYLSMWSKEPASDVGRRVAALLEVWDGLHHFEDAAMRKVNWSDPHFVLLTVRGRLATFDFDALTRLVFLAHDHCIRVEVCPCNGHCLKLAFHPRSRRNGGMAARHSTLEKAYTDWRRQHIDIRGADPELVDSQEQRP